MITKKQKRRIKIKHSIRKKIFGTAQRPRLSVHRSNSAIQAQIIDDNEGKTLASASSKQIDKERKSVNIELAKEVGKKLAEVAKEKSIDKVIFDRNGYLYHGKVKALAEGAREAGLIF